MTRYRGPRGKNSIKNHMRNIREERQKSKAKRLDMRKSDEFNFMLGKAVEDLPESTKGAIRGSIYAIVSKKGTKEAKDFIGKKHTEGLIDTQTQKRLLDLIFDYSKYR